MTRETMFATPQEQFWAGEFGSDYIARNDNPALVASNIRLFSQALRRAGRVRSCLEFGANIGLNLQALRQCHPDAHLTAVEINGDAARVLAETIGEENVYHGSILDFEPQVQADLTFTKGVLIHIHPEMLDRVYEKLYAASSRCILVCEYYNPTPVTLPYRGHEQRLFKRDFAGELMDRYADLQLLDYGFAYHRDPAFPQDDLTWFLMEKRR